MHEFENPIYPATKPNLQALIGTVSMLKRPYDRYLLQVVDQQIQFLQILQAIHLSFGASGSFYNLYSDRAHQVCLV